MDSAQAGEWQLGRCAWDVPFVRVYLLTFLAS